MASVAARRARPFGIDARAAAEVPAGRGRYVRQLLAALAADGERDAYLLYARRTQPFPAADQRLRWRLSALPDPVWHAAAAVRASRECSAFLSTNSYLTAWATTVPTVVVIHDLIALAPDGGAQPGPARIERATIRPALRRAAALLCVSETTRRELVGRFPHAEARARTVPLAADPRFGEAVEPAVLDRPYVLAVGTLEPRKNLARLIAAFAALPHALRSAHRLVLVGRQGGDVDAAIAAAGARPSDVLVLGQVDDDRLHALYAGAACFAYPSLQEGFGLPVLEAMAAGAPVVTSSVSSLPEVAGDAAVLADPRDVRSIRDSLQAVLGDPERASALRAAGRARAGTFSWGATAAATRELLRAVATRDVR